MEAETGPQSPAFWADVSLSSIHSHPRVLYLPAQPVQDQKYPRGKMLPPDWARV